MLHLPKEGAYIRTHSIQKVVFQGFWLSMVQVAIMAIDFHGSLVHIQIWGLPDQTDSRQKA